MKKMMFKIVAGLSKNNSVIPDDIQKLLDELIPGLYCDRTVLLVNLILTEFALPSAKVFVFFVLSDLKCIGLSRQIAILKNYTQTADDFSKWVKLFVDNIKAQENSSEFGMLIEKFSAMKNPNITDSGCVPTPVLNENIYEYDSASVSFIGLPLPFFSPLSASLASPASHVSPASPRYRDDVDLSFASDNSCNMNNDGSEVLPKPLGVSFLKDSRDWETFKPSIVPAIKKAFNSSGNNKKSLEDDVISSLTTFKKEIKVSVILDQILKNNFWLFFGHSKFKGQLRIVCDSLRVSPNTDRKMTLGEAMAYPSNTPGWVNDQQGFF